LDELTTMQTQLALPENNEFTAEEYIIAHIDNPKGRIKFKDRRKVSIGLASVDLVPSKQRKRGEFFNCVAAIIRIRNDAGLKNARATEIYSQFREYHVKIFNTGKIEIPGVRHTDTFWHLVNITIDHLKRADAQYADIHPVLNTHESVLINSNFRYMSFIDRNILTNILKQKYGIQAGFDPCCSYPGVRCKFYYDLDLEVQTGVRPACMPANCCERSRTALCQIPDNIVMVSLSIFRTGSVLISGKCPSDKIVFDVREFFVDIFRREHALIAT